MNTCIPALLFCNLISLISASLLADDTPMGRSELCKVIANTVSPTIKTDRRENIKVNHAVLSSWKSGKWSVREAYEMLPCVIRRQLIRLCSSELISYLIQ